MSEYACYFEMAQSSNRSVIFSGNHMESSNKVDCLDNQSRSAGSKSTKELLKSAFSIHNDIMNQNLKSSPGEEFFNFMGRLVT